MFSKTITNSGKFLKMPSSSRLLYYDLGMNADDDGYTEWFTVVKMTGSTEQDLQVLHANGFVKIFDENVLIILDWKENNYLRPDRYTPSKYIGKYDENTVRLESGIPTVDTGKVRLGKVNTSTETSSVSEFSLKEELQTMLKSERRDIRIISWFIHTKEVPLKSKEQLSQTIKRHIRAAKSLEAFDVGQLKNAAFQAEQQYGNKWTLETVYKLLTK